MADRCFQPFLYHSLPLIGQLSARRAYSQRGSSLLFVTLLCGQIQASGLTYTPSSPFRKSGAPLSATSFGQPEKKNTGPQTCCHLVLGQLGSDPLRRRALALDLLVDTYSSSPFQVDSSRTSASQWTAAGPLSPGGWQLLLPFSGGWQLHLRLLADGYCSSPFQVDGSDCSPFQTDSSDSSVLRQPLQHHTSSVLRSSRSPTARPSSIPGFSTSVTNFTDGQGGGGNRMKSNAIGLQSDQQSVAWRRWREPRALTFQQQQRPRAPRGKASRLFSHPSERLAHTEPSITAHNFTGSRI
ncbi:hypothetical protein PGIGA_G00002700 [Pangasianodon gigas]|uniref:Uncharacterized protein n=1 Tax=Pangasianodon gigas TaxID=30993 RepID=A0ACC5W538_PANGG|nr:hypothetical protein [Pangasianodon gigas]